jgi:hypothetical protein
LGAGVSCALRLKEKQRQAKMTAFLNNCMVLVFVWCKEPLLMLSYCNLGVMI